MSKEALAHEEAVQKAALAIADARGIAETDRTFGMMSVFRADADAVLRSVSHLPDREEVAVELAGHFAAREWAKMAETRRELKILVRIGRNDYDINEPTRDDCRAAASDVLSLMERKA